MSLHCFWYFCYQQNINLMNSKKQILINVSCILVMMFSSLLHLSAKDIYVNQKTWRQLVSQESVKLQAGDRVFFKRGEVYKGVLRVTGQGSVGSPILIDAYGKGTKPCIIAPKDSLYTILVYNSDYLTVQNIDITNYANERIAGRTGIKVSCVDYGVSHGLTLRSLNVHDIKGSLIKHSGEGSGILIHNQWDSIPSAFDSLLVEDCVVRRCERNGIIWSANSDRTKWFPNRHVVVRKCLIDQVPGDGIVPIGCDSVLVEYNLMRDCPDILPEREAAAGMWPWSCDNSIIQFNEVTGHKAHWDGQGFDCDYNCNNTIIRYNYSHDNYGGFLLVCSPKIDSFNMGNVGSVVEYNLSVNDGIRPYPARTKKHFSPIIHISGPCYNTLISHNIIYNDGSHEKDEDPNFIYSGEWDDIAKCTYILDNVFYTNKDSLDLDISNSIRTYLCGNKVYPAKSFDLQKIPMRKVVIADGEAEVICLIK